MGGGKLTSMGDEPRHASVGTWLHRIESIGPGSLLYIIETRLGAAAARHVTPDDIFQDLMLSVCRSASGLEWRGPAAFRSWVLTVIDHRIADAARRGARAPEHRSIGDIPDDLRHALEQTTTPSRVASYREEARVIREALCRLPQELRDIVRARVIEQKTLGEIAESAGLTVGVVRHRLRTGSEMYTSELRRLMVTGNGSGAP